MTHQRLPLVAFTPATPNIPLSAVEESLTTGGPTLDVSNRIGDNVVWGISMNPESFMESKLERLTLSGPCVIAAPDLVVLYRNRDHLEENKVLVDGSVAEIENEVSYSTGTITDNTITTTTANRSFLQLQCRIEGAIAVGRMVRIDSDDDEVTACRQRGIRVLELEGCVFAVDKQDEAWYDDVYCN
ncbi:MAG: hypothetical protein J3R72DRAFT_484708 [Linnemannia gamsii]|nr:MAG: hypothetical protein J3R72DRAFT_484708 [Linnemannia gamsii]